MGTKRPRQYKHRALEERFWVFVDKTPGQGRWGDCWGWRGSTAQGYGQMGRSIKRDDGTYSHPPLRAHVLSYQIHYGPVPDGLEVCHSCDNPPCCNPDHLSAETHAENIRQASVRRGLVEEVSLSTVPADRFWANLDELDRALDAPALRQMVNCALDTLSDKQRKAIALRYGLDGVDRTLQQVAEATGVSRQRIQQLEIAGLDRIRRGGLMPWLRAAFYGAAQEAVS